MKGSKNGRCDRRNVLRGVGACIALPFLEALQPRRRTPAPGRLAIFAVPFGMLEDSFHPASTGHAYELGPVLAPLAPLRTRFTLFTNLDHAQKGGHAANHTLLSGVRLSDRAQHPEGNVTLDQRAAELLGGATRFPSLVFWEQGMSFTRTGVRVPALRRPSEAFRQLFVPESTEERSFLRASMATRTSILDAVRAEAKALERTLGPADKDRLEEYLGAIRATELQLRSEGEWLERPKPALDEPSLAGVAEGGRDEPDAGNLLEVWFDLMYFALLTDSTRVVTTSLGHCSFGLDGVDQGYHTLSHHGHRPDRLEPLRTIECFLMEQFARFLARLESTTLPDGGTLLDSTQVLFGSGLGNGNRHTNTNLPLILAGGPHAHGQHLDLARAQPLCNLYLSMLQGLGCELEHFNLSTGTLTGLEPRAAARAPEDR